jgi:hypothetical protein
MNARVLLLLAAVTPAFAQFTAIDTPTGSYTGSTTVIPIVGADSASVASLTNGVQTVSFSSNLDIHTVPGGGWSTWASPPNTESATPRVVGTYNNSIGSMTLTLATPATTFGFELEPNTFNNYSFTATFRNGSTVLGTITRTVNGDGGARLFAASSSTPITSVIITAPNGFALAQIRYGNPATATVPTLTTTGIFGLGALLAAAGALLARKQQLA